MPAIRRQRISLYEPDVDESKAGTQRHDDQRNGEHTTHQSATPQWMVVFAMHHRGSPAIRSAALALLRRDDPAESDSLPVLSSMWNEPTGVARVWVVMELCRQRAPGSVRSNLDSRPRPLSKGCRGLRNRYFSQKVHTLPSSATRHQNSLCHVYPHPRKLRFVGSSLVRCVCGPEGRPRLYSVATSESSPRGTGGCSPLRQQATQRLAPRRLRGVRERRTQRPKVP